MTTIIIGAGMAGIAAATQLTDYILIEPREYIGGRLRTVREPFGPIELGAGWFHETKEGACVNPLIGIAQEAGIEAAYDDHDLRVYSLNGKLSPEALGSIPAKWEELRASAPESSIEALAELFADSHGPIAREFALAQTLGQGLPAALGTSKYAALDGRDQVAINGYDQVLEPLLAQIDPSKIKLGEGVTEVRWESNKVTVVTTKKEYSGARVIVTVPLAVLKAQDITFMPPLPANLEGAIEQGSVAVLGKVYAEFPTKFWGDFDKALVVGEDPALVYNWCKEHSSARNVLSCICIGDTCRAAESAAKPADAFAPVKKFFDAVNESGAPTPDPTFVRASSWSQDPFAKGSFSTFPYGTKRADAVAAFEQGAAPLFFAGEHTTLKGATFLHGAYLSGLRAAAQAKQ